MSEKKNPFSSPGIQPHKVCESLILFWFHWACVGIILESPSLFIFALFSVVWEFFYDFSFPAHLMFLFVLFVLHFHHSSDSRRATVSLLVSLLFFCSVFGRTNPGEQIWNQNVFVFLKLCLRRHKCSPCVSSDFSFILLLLSLLSFFVLYRRWSGRWEVSLLWSSACFFSVSPHFSDSTHISQCSLLFYFFFFLVSPISLLDHFPIFLFSSSTCLCLVSFDMLTPFSSSTVLSGVFQTHGACQEAPGLAHLSPCFTPTRSNARLQSCASS